MASVHSNTKAKDSNIYIVLEENCNTKEVGEAAVKSSTASKNLNAAGNQASNAGGRPKPPKAVGPGTTEKTYLNPRGGYRVDFQVAQFEA